MFELACGTGEDARHLAARGVRVFATDHSEAMLKVARQKCAGLPVEFARLDLHHLEVGILDLGFFDGAFSNFGGFNALSNFQLLVSNLHRLVKPGGRLLFVLMGRWCAWEIFWHLAHGDARTALRRLQRGGVVAQVGAAAMMVYYPSTAELCRAFAPHFRLVRVRPLGNFLPPSYLEPLTRCWWFPFRLFASLDAHLLWPLWADHTIYEWVREAP